MSEYIKNTYNNMVGDELHGNYEYDRWFKTPGQKAGYEMTKITIENKVLPYLSKQKLNILELGSGPGTWTKFLLSSCPEANFDLVDISKEMLKLAQESLKNYPNNINFYESDFLNFDTDNKYDVFFSSRVIEYIKEKKVLVRKINNILRSGGQGFIITKTPHYGRQRLLGRSVPKMHRDQISPKVLKRILLEYNFQNIEIYPVVMNFYFSFVKSLWGNWFLFNLLHKYHINFFSQHFSESYIVKFRKP